MKKVGRPKSKDQLTDAQIESALKKCGGFITHTAEQLGCSPANISKRVEKSKRLQQAIRDTQESHLDLGESKLVKLMKDENLGAIKFYLYHKGKQRGYEKEVDTSSDILDKVNELMAQFSGNLPG